MNVISTYGCKIVFDIFKKLIRESNSDFISNEYFTASYLPQIMSPSSIIIMKNDKNNTRISQSSNKHTFLYEDFINYSDLYYSACTDYAARLDKFINDIVGSNGYYFNYFN